MGEEIESRKSMRVFSLSLSPFSIRIILSNSIYFKLFPMSVVFFNGGILEGLKEIILRLSDNEHNDYVIKGQSIYSKRMKRRITDEEYSRWVFLLGEYYKGQCFE
jgi:hypothetical protein